MLRGVARNLAWLLLCAGAGCGGDFQASQASALDCEAAVDKLDSCGLLESGASCNTKPLPLCEVKCTTTATCRDLTAEACRVPGNVSDCIEACSAETLTCSDGSGSYTGAQKCDGLADCANGSDEAGCPTFNCGADAKIPEALRCDDVQDCPGGQDEADCAGAITTVCPVSAGTGGGVGSGGEGGEASGAGGSAGTGNTGGIVHAGGAGTGGLGGSFAGTGGTAGANSGGTGGTGGTSGTGGSAGAIGNYTVADFNEACGRIEAALDDCAGTFDCRGLAYVDDCMADCLEAADCMDRVNYACTGLSTTIETCFDACFQESVVSCNGMTFPGSYVCDDIDDCTNRADEIGCTNALFTCSDNTTIPSLWRCDAIDDCPNAEDEEACACPDGPAHNEGR